MLLAVALAAPAASAQTITRGPIIQNPEALTTTVTILWWTNVVGDSTVQYGTTPALGSSVTVPTAASCEIGAAGTCHVVPLTGLQPGTRYYYRLLTNGVEVQPPGSYFTTLRDPSDPHDLFFTVIGDWGQASAAEADVANLQDADDTPLILTVGDNAYQNGTQSDWDNNALAYYVSPMRRALFVPALGNHDLYDVGNSNWASSVEIRMFQLPRNAPPGQEERYFSFDHGDAHFVVLDSNVPGDGTQRAWLEADLAATTRKWKFVFLHHTPYSCANGIASLGSNSTVRSSWNPLFEYYGVDVVFDGHDHIYERSLPLDEFSDAAGTAGADGRSTIYVMTGGGGATLDNDANVDASGPYRKPFFFSPREDCYWLASGCSGGPSSGGGPSYCSFERYSYTAVRLVGNTTLTVSTIDRNDVVIDSFSIVRSTPTTTTTTTATTTTTSSTTTTTTTTSTTAPPTTTTSTTTTTAPPPPTTTTSTTAPPTTTTSTTTTSTTTSTSTTTTSTTTSTSSTTTSSTTTTLPCSDGDGDGVCDATDVCPATPDPAQLDGDGDGLGDACDPCTGPSIVANGRLTLGRLAPPPNDDRLKLKGRMTVPQTPAIDPAARGGRLLVQDAGGATVFDVTVPAGLYDAGTATGWKVLGSGWQYRNRAGLQGLTKLTVKPAASGLLTVSAIARDGSFAVTAGQLPLRFTIVVEGPFGENGQCGEATFISPTVPRCVLSASGTTLKCR